MAEQDLHATLDRLFTGDFPDPAACQQSLEALLAIESRDAQKILTDYADRVRLEHVGQGVLLRGIVEFSNRCQRTCHYCGLNIGNASLSRYALSGEDILASVESLHKAGIRTVVLQSGEVDTLPAEWLAEIVRDIRQRWPDMAITLSVGEKPEQTYALWKQAGADRYLLKIETTDPALYERLHPGMSLENRKNCLTTLRRLGYQTGSGGIVGLPGQTNASLARDILFYRERQFDMIGISPLIPHPETPLADTPLGDLNRALKVIALTRIVAPRAHMPATTAMGSMQGVDHRPRALQAGCNVVMLNYTPLGFKQQYEIYPGKRCLKESFCAVGCITRMAESIGRFADLSVGHAIAFQREEV
jgi:biotin synthase